MSNVPERDPAVADSAVTDSVAADSAVTDPVPAASPATPEVQPAAEPQAEVSSPVAAPQAAAPQTQPEHTQPAETQQAAATPKKPQSVSIGSQRDVADKSLASAVPKAVREAKKTEIDIPSASPPPDLDPTGVPGLTVDQLSDEWDADVGELDDFNMDDVMGEAEARKVSGEEIPAETRLKGSVTRVHNDDVFVSLTGQHEGVVSLRTLKEAPEVGAEIEVVVNRYNAADSLYDLTVPGSVISVSDWSDIVEGSIVDAKVTKSNTGGLECMINGIRGFIPASQISRFRVENLEDFVDQRLQCVVTEANPSKRNLVLSHRAVLEREQAEKREELMQTLEVGNQFDGTVTRLMDFGAFVDIGGIEGLVHISKLAWDRVTHPRDVLEEGQKIKVVVEKIDPDTGKIGLSYRDTLEHPWEGIESKYPIDSTVTGTVSRLANFGAFVRLEMGIEGLIHISELAHYRVHTVKTIVNEGDQVEVKVLSVDRDAQRIGLSLKATQAAPAPKKEGTAEAETPETEAAAQTQRPKRTKPLKGGTSRKSGGEDVGLNW